MIKTTITFALVICMALPCKSQNGIRINKWISGVSIPVDISHCGDDRLFVIEKTGKIRIIKDNSLVASPFLDITTKVRSSGNEQGLLGMAFHPDYKKNGLLYVNYTDRSNSTMTVIEEYKVSADSNKIDSTSGRMLLTVVQPYTNHNGGCIKFGKDGYLYIGMGDGGSANDPQNNAQNKKSRLGKILRIDVDTSASFKVPASNPFVHDSSYLPEIWAVGMRNPWRFSMDKLTGDIWIGDVGQGSWEEVDFEPYGDPGGHNYGWRCYEGNADFNLAGCDVKSKFTFPIFDYLSDETINGCSVTGGYVYRGSRFPTLYGKYIYGDYCSGKIWTLEKKAGNAYANTLVFDFTNNALTSFGEDAQGNLYFADASTSSIYQILDTCTLQVQVKATDVTCNGGQDGRATTNLSGIGGVRFLWSTGDTSATLEKLAPGNYSVTVNNGNCIATQDFKIGDKIPDSTCITLPMRISFCKGDSTVLIACDEIKAKSNIWYRNGNELQERGKRLWVYDSGTYQVRYVDSAGCASLFSNAVDIEVFPVPGKVQLQVLNDSLFTESGYSSYRWFRLGALVGSSIAPYWLVRNGADGPYQVEVIDSNGCHSPLSDPVNVVIPATRNPNEIADGLIHISPHPVSDQLQFRTAMEFKNWSILDMHSKLFLNGHLEAGQLNVHQLEVSSLSPGIYVLQLQNGVQQAQCLFIKL